MAPHSAHYWGLGPGQEVDRVTKTLAPECPRGQPPSYVVWIGIPIIASSRAADVARVLRGSLSKAPSE